MSRYDASWVEVRFEPLDSPVKAQRGTEQTRFTARWSDSLLLLRREAGQLGCREVVLCVDAPRSAMRQDGGIRANATPATDGVEVYLPESNVGPLRYSCARFTGSGWSRYLPGWQANVRAVALGMEALRTVERYGLGAGTEQYRGFSALPPGDPIAVGAAMTVEDAARLLADADPRVYADDEWRELLREAGAIRSAYREAAREHHPDAGGDPAVFRRITEARDLLLAHA